MHPTLLNIPVPIETPRLILRPPQIGDGKMVNQAIIESFANLSEFMPWAGIKPTLEDSEIFVRQAAANWILKNNDEPYLPLLLIHKEDHQLVGSSGFHHYDWTIPSIETGYWMRDSYSGKGLMTEAVNALTQYAFKQLGVKRFTITCDIDNIRSKRIPEMLGFSLDGVLKSSRKKPLSGELTDTLVYSRRDLNGLDDLLVTW